MNRLNVLSLGLAGAVTLALLNLACALAFAIAPDAALAAVNSWLHGIDLKPLVPPGGKPLEASKAAVSAAVSGAVGFVAFALVAALYNFLTRKDRS